MGWKNKLSAEMLKEWKEKVLIIVLSGILLLVIFLPTGGKTEEDALWGKAGDSVFKGSLGGMEDETVQGGVQRTASEGEEGKVKQGDEEAYAAWLEQRLARTLAYIDGVGAVKVMITLQDSGEKIVEKDIPSSRSVTTENDSEGGNRSIHEYESSETTIYLTGSDGSQSPYIVCSQVPKIEGVVVVAEGGQNPQTVQNITDVIEALFGVEPHKIKVVRMTTLEGKERGK
ncbi:MAG: stage III sporulation protein AG [Lachnospiraceae bacterium]|nr:stage III sporulation protein AG [Lachnospiraceae bacterium]